MDVCTPQDTEGWEFLLLYVNCEGSDRTRSAYAQLELGVAPHRARGCDLGVHHREPRGALDSPLDDERLERRRVGAVDVREGVA